MADIALFHSVLGVRHGVRDAASRLREAGHSVHVVDQYDGRSFDDYEEASAFAEGIGYPALMARAADAVAHLPDGFVALGFSNGAGMAEHVALQRRTSGVVLIAGALPLEMLGAQAWPADTPAQIHYTRADPFRREDWIDAVKTSIHAAGAAVQQFDYAGAGHLFTDPSLAAEYDAAATAQVWERVLAFCAAATATASAAAA